MLMEKAKHSRHLSESTQRKRRMAMVAAMNSLYAYKLRDTELRMMGYPSYQAYRSSALWSRIRKRVFGRCNRCEYCGETANQIHHSSYHRAVLEGWDLSYLHAVCGDCHNYGEYDGAGKKTCPAVATQRMKERPRGERVSNSPLANPASVC